MKHSQRGPRGGANRERVLISLIVNFLKAGAAEARSIWWYFLFQRPVRAPATLSLSHAPQVLFAGLVDDHIHTLSVNLSGVSIY